MSALSAFILLTTGFSAGAKVSNLRCEYLKDPITVETNSPRLSWITETGQRDWTQSAYRIIVASSPKILAENRGNLWDSGKILGSNSIQIPYFGSRLRSRQDCFWKVRVWDRSDAPSNWSRPGHWEMGLLEPADWGESLWIGAAPDPTDSLAAPYLRKRFVTKKQVSRATLYACGLGYAELRLNGRKIGGNAERDPGYTNFGQRVLYVGYDVTRLIQQGANMLGAILGTGWYDVHDLATWRFDKAPWRDRPKLRLILDIEYSDGTTQRVVSGPSWQASHGPIRFDGIYTGEVYDARLESPGWDGPGSDPSGWMPAIEMKAPRGVLSGRPCPPIRVTQTIPAVKLTEPKAGVYIVDFGQNIAGHARIHLKGQPGAKVTMRYSERVGVDGMIERSQIDVFMKKTIPPQPFQTDTYICKGVDLETWEPIFSYSGFRYMELTGFPGKPKLADFEARMANTDVASSGDFSCSNDLLNKIQKATRYSYLSNAQSIPTDCPQREKNGWTGDAHLAAEAGLMNFDSASFYTKWLNDLADDQQQDGKLSLIVPSGGWGQGDLHPAWNSAYPMIADDLYRYEGDTRALAEHYSHIRRYVDLLASQSPGGLVPFDSLGDWLPWSTQTPSQITSTVCLYIDAHILEQEAERLGNSADVKKYRDLATQVKAGFQSAYLKPEQVKEATQTTLSLALYFGLVQPNDRTAVLNALTANVESQGHIDTGIIGAKYLLRALSEAGRTDLAYRIVSRKAQPGWGWWIEQGATTLWEDWKGESSLNHIMFGDVSNWFFQWIAGIGLDPRSPAFKHILFHPQPVGDLTWAAASENGPYGKIVSSWKREGRQFRLNIQVPPNCSATVRVPGEAGPEYAQVGVKTPGATSFEVGSGKYLFQSKLSQ
jgi:alpha-L-rhamnosidase